jgi:protein TonB
MSPGMLVRRMEPRYPPAAIAARIEGPVKIKAIINREGIIEQAEVLSGSPLLTRAALEAIREWRYRPYMLNGVPVEVETQITVNFVLSR